MRKKSKWLVATICGFILLAALLIVSNWFDTAKKIASPISDVNGTLVAKAEGDEPELPILKAPPMVPASQPVTQLIARGFVFYGGKYIEAPYSVSSREGRTYINYNAITLGMAPVKALPIERQDPGVPPNLTEKSGFYDLFVNTGNPAKPHAIRKWEYIVSTTPRGKAVGDMIDYLKSLPPVAKVDIFEEPLGDLSATLQITMKNGQKKFFTLAPPIGLIEDSQATKSSPWTQPSLGTSATQAAPTANTDDGENLSTVDSDEMTWIVSRLTNGDALIFDGNGNIVTLLGNKKAASCLGAAVELLKSSRNNEEKILLLQQAGMLAPGKPSRTPELITNFVSSDQLDQRVMQAVLETGVTPVRVMDLEAASKSN